MHKTQWREDHTAAYERYTWKTWVVYRNGDPQRAFTVYDTCKLGEEIMLFDTPEHAKQYAETMEAVGA